jgi:uncharacterized membrane-anchored protein
MASRHHTQETDFQVFGSVQKVPAVKPYFWGVKLLTTAMGEAVSDYFVNKYNPYVVVLAGFVVFAAAMIWQFRTRGYRTWPYWSAVSMVAVFGTMVADAMHVALHIPYKVSASLFAVCLAITFITWYRAEGTLSIHSIVTPRRECFYWATVIFTFAMGTALGDLTAITFHLGYIASAFGFTALICVPLVAWRLGANSVATFWTAYVLTRPIGASFADFFGMPKSVSGMGYGHGAVSVVTLVLVLASFAYLSRSGIDRPEPEAAHVGTQGGGPRHAGTHRYADATQYGEAQQYAEAQRRYADAQRAEPRYGDPRYGDPRQADPRYGDPRYADPRQADPRQAGPRQGAPRHGGRSTEDSPGGWQR